MTTFPGYRDVRLLRTGRQSSVYRAVELASGRPVALKAVNPGGAAPRELEAFARESAVLAALSAHPNILTMYDSFVLDARPVLVLELCPQSLADRLAGKQVPDVPDAVATAIKLCGALETAHSGGVLHRDVRPEHVLITEYAEPALADFGVARLRGTAPPVADLFDFPGPHVAPELLLGQEATAATDVYGLASTLYEMLCGTPPHAAYAGEAPAATILRVLRDPVRPIERAGVPYALSDLVLWAMAKEPGQRPPSLAWFAEELAGVETHNGWPRTAALIREPARQVAVPEPLDARYGHA
jgi:serine/threonine protein kinase